MTKASGHFIEHGFGELPTVLTKERLDELVTKLRETTITPEELQELAGGHLRLAIWTAAKYSKYAKHLGDELLGEAAFGLAEALSLAPEKLRDLEITPFISTYMKKYVLQTLNEDATISIPIRSLKRNELQKIVTVGKVEEIIDPQKKLDELRETIYAAVKHDFEREVIKLRELGLNDLQVAEKLACSREKVGKAKLKVYRRFLQAETT